MFSRFAISPLAAIATLMLSSGIALGYYTAPATVTQQVTATPTADASSPPDNSPQYDPTQPRDDVTPPPGVTQPIYTAPPNESIPAPNAMQPVNHPSAAETLPPATPTPNPGTVVVGGTPVSVSLAQAVSSSSAQQGQAVGITVNKEVDANGMVVIARGAPGQATLAQVDHAGSNGRAGKIALDINWIRSVDGGKIALSTVDHADDGGSAKDEARGATVAGYLLFGPVGLFAHNFIHGKDVTVGTDQVFKVYIDHTIHVASTQQAADPEAGFDH